MLEPIQFRNQTLSIPIIQGGMGVGISLSSLAGAVMKEGGMGVVSAAHPGYDNPNFFNNSFEANIKALKYHAQKAKEIANGNGILAVNIMMACNRYDEYVKACVEAGYQAIISGAGMPLSLPEYVKDDSILLAPIVSSGKAARLILRTWHQRYQRTPDFIVLESSLAGGHLGFKESDLIANTCDPLSKILEDVLDEIKSYEQMYQRKIPLFVAGGIYDHDDIKKYVSLGASGVQMGTRFIATYECDADIAFKQAIVNATEKDIVLVKSPTGFPGRALNNTFIKNVAQQGNIKVTRCIGCLRPCNPSDTPYCISKALIEAVKGNVEQGLIFAGANAYRIHKLLTVHELMNELILGK